MKKKLLLTLLWMLILQSVRTLAQQRPVTVRDVIELTSLGAPGYFLGGGSVGRVADVSPGGSNFAIVTRHGDLRDMVNVFDLLIYRSDDAVHDGAAPFLRLTYKSSSNRAAVHSLTWSMDGRQLFFIGESPGQVAQLMRLDIASGAVKTLTHSKTAVLSYAQNDGGTTIMYVAQAEWQTLWVGPTERSGVVISNQRLQDLITGRAGYRYRGLEDEFDLFVQEGSVVRKIPLDRNLVRNMKPALSPDGKHAIVRTRLLHNEVPNLWRNSSFPWAEFMFKYDAHRQEMESSFLVDEIIDLETGKSGRLLNVPAAGFSQDFRPIWVRGGKAVVLRSYVTDHIASSGVTREVSVPQTIEVDIASSEVKPILTDCVDPVAWDENKHLLQCKAELRKGEHERQDTFFERGEKEWARHKQPATYDRRPLICLREDYKTPPKIVAVDRVTGRERTLIDLNPGLNNLVLARVEEVSWKGPDRKETKAGLYYPVDFKPGRRYPLIIQTHDWNPNRFQLDGPWTTGYAAQPLAARGFFVLQLDEMSLEDFLSLAHQKEVDKAIKVYRSAIDNLVGKGLVDGSRVGVVGFSHTCFYVKYALAHTDLFAAASVAEGEDGGYLQYITRNNSYVDPVSMYGGGPYGENLSNWLKESPGFNLTNVKAPLRITVLNPHRLLTDWEWFSGLSELKKPVDVVMFKDGDHVLQKPYERLNIGEGNVDWFDFWLQDKEDPDPSKQEQYKRWRAMREEFKKRHLAGTRP